MKLKYDYNADDIQRLLSSGLSMRATARALKYPEDNMIHWLHRNYKIEKTVQVKLIPKATKKAKTQHKYEPEADDSEEIYDSEEIDESKEASEHGGTWEEEAEIYIADLRKRQAAEDAAKKAE